MADKQSREVTGDKPSFIDPDDFNFRHKGAKMKATDRAAQRPESPKSTTSEYAGGVDHATSGKDLTARMDLGETIKDLKAIQREARKTTATLKELEGKKKNKYLVIELDGLGEVPRVFHKGKEITMKEFVNFQWTTRSDAPGNTDIIVDYFEKSDSGLPMSKSIREGISS